KDLRRKAGVTAPLDPVTAAPAPVAELGGERAPHAKPAPPAQQRPQHQPPAAKNKRKTDAATTPSGPSGRSRGRRGGSSSKSATAHGSTPTAPRAAGQRFTTGSTVDDIRRAGTRRRARG